MTASAGSQIPLTRLADTYIEILPEYSGTATAFCNGANGPVIEATNTGAEDVTFSNAGTGYPLHAGETITVIWPNGNDGAPIPVLGWEMLIPGTDTVVESGTLQLPDCPPPTTEPPTTELPETGSSSGWIAVAAAAFVLAGSALFTVRRRTS